MTHLGLACVRCSLPDDVWFSIAPPLLSPSLITIAVQTVLLIMPVRPLRVMVVIVAVTLLDSVFDALMLCVPHMFITAVRLPTAAAIGLVFLGTWQGRTLHMAWQPETAATAPCSARFSNSGCSVDKRGWYRLCVGPVDLSPTSSLPSCPLQQVTLLLQHMHRRQCSCSCPSFVHCIVCGTHNLQPRQYSSLPTLYVLLTWEGLA